MKMDLEEFLDLYGFQGNQYSGEIIPTDFGVTPCPFLKYDREKAICKIYPVRPWVCREYSDPDILCRAGLKRD
jgi:Fe-S-cluster containining protein